MLLRFFRENFDSIEKIDWIEFELKGKEWRKLVWSIRSYLPWGGKNFFSSFIRRNRSELCILCLLSDQTDNSMWIDRKNFHCSSREEKTRAIKFESNHYIRCSSLFHFWNRFSTIILSLYCLVALHFINFSFWLNWKVIFFFQTPYAHTHTHTLTDWREIYLINLHLGTHLCHSFYSIAFNLIWNFIIEKI